jgi:radical SAM superfamily enzyme YgiQ (UPF0313 family)
MLNKEILLFNPKTVHEKNYRNFWIPYSILSLGSELEKYNYGVTLIDNNLESLSPDKFSSILGKFKKPVLVGVSSMIGHQIQEGLVFASQVKKTFPETKIVWGGAAPTILTQEFAKSPMVDIIVRGQGEKTLVEVAKALENKSNLSDIPGIVYRDEETFVKSPEKNISPKKNMAQYSYDLIPTARYIREDEHISDKVLNHVSSVGCPYGCGFCSEVALYRRKWQPELIGRTIDEVSLLVEKYGANGIKFYDANFFVNKNRVLTFAQNVIEKGWEINWAASAHPKSLLSYTKEEFSLLKKSGLSRILIGAESGNEDELKFIQKGVTTKEVLKVAKMLKNFEIHGSFTIIVGYPGFPEENIKRTLDFGEKIMKKGPIHEVKAHIYTPFPGTPLYDQAIKHGFIPPKTLEDWSNYDYYEVQTPWLRSDLTKLVTQYNEEYCPYVL